MRNKTSPFDPRLTSGGLLLTVLLCLPVSASALDYQLHGFAAQGFVLSNGNNAFGHSTTGSVALNEFGANITVDLARGLLFSAQALVRNAGATDDGRLRLDYAQLDYQFLNTADYTAGARIGRVKNPFGLFNETRDVVFTRPGILLPQATYFDGQGFRSLLFASNGAQVYGGVTNGEHYTSLVFGAGLNTQLSDLEKRQLTGGTPLPAEVEISNFHLARLQDEIDGGLWRFAASYLHATLGFIPDPGSPISGSADVDLYLLSVRYNGRNYSLTSEYSLTASKGNTTFTGPIDSKSDGIYVQGDYLLTSQWSVMGRYDLSFANRNDRDGSMFAAQTGGDRYSQFSRDATVGVKWQFDEHWGVWGEYHLIDGTATVSQLDNQGRTLDDHWSMFLMMAAYRF